MDQVLGGDIVELTPPELAEINGGTGGEVAVAMYLARCFKAGFDFGFNTVGPMIFG